MDSATIAIIISVFALIISGITLWCSHLRPFKVNVSFDVPRLSLYTISPEVSGDQDSKTWWIPSFDLGLTISNKGSRQGDIHDIRIVASKTSHRTEKKLYYYPKWIVDYAIFNQCDAERFEWLNKAILRDWYPFRLSGGKEVECHLILEGDRLDHKEPGRLAFELQIATSEKQGWQTLGDFELFVSEEDYDTQSTFSPMNKKIEKLRSIA